MNTVSERLASFEHAEVPHAAFVTQNVVDCLVKIDGEWWLRCPVGGGNCARVNADTLGADMARDVMSVHFAVAHTRWR